MTSTTASNPSLFSKQATAFRKAFGVPRDLSPVGRSLQTRLIIEEFKEFLQAEGEMNLMMPNTRADCLKELADLVYVCWQYAANMGWDLDEALDRVHESNMSKLDDSGQPVKRADGKILKSDNYKPPSLEDLI